MWDRRVHLLFTILISFLALSLQGCTLTAPPQDTAPEVQLTIRFAGELRLSQPAAMDLEILEEGGQPVVVPDISLQLAPADAKKAWRLVEPKYQAPGIYTATLHWSQAGRWSITVLGTLKDGRTINRTFQVEVGGG